MSGFIILACPKCASDMMQVYTGRLRLRGKQFIFTWAWWCMECGEVRKGKESSASYLLKRRLGR